MVTGKDGVREIVKVALTRRTAIFLPRWWGGVTALLGHLIRIARRTEHALGPAQLTHHFVALGIVKQALKVEHGRVQLANNSPCSLADYLLCYPLRVMPQIIEN